MESNSSSASDLCAVVGINANNNFRLAYSKERSQFPNLLQKLVQVIDSTCYEIFKPCIHSFDHQRLEKIRNTDGFDEERKNFYTKFTEEMKTIVTHTVVLPSSQVQDIIDALYSRYSPIPASCLVDRLELASKCKFVLWFPYDMVIEKANETDDFVNGVFFGLVNDNATLKIANDPSDLFAFHKQSTLKEKKWLIWPLYSNQLYHQDFLTKNGKLVNKARAIFNSETSQLELTLVFLAHTPNTFLETSSVIGKRYMGQQALYFKALFMVDPRSLQQSSDLSEDRPDMEVINRIVRTFKQSKDWFVTFTLNDAFRQQDSSPELCAEWEQMVMQCFYNNSVAEQTLLLLEGRALGDHALNVLCRCLLHSSSAKHCKVEFTDNDDNMGYRFEITKTVELLVKKNPFGSNMIAFILGPKREVKQLQDKVLLYLPVKVLNEREYKDIKYYFQFSTPSFFTNKVRLDADGSILSSVKLVSFFPRERARIYIVATPAPVFDKEIEMSLHWHQKKDEQQIYDAAKDLKY